MENNLHLQGKLDFTEIDLTPPDKIIKKILEQLPAETNGIVCGEIIKYEGAVMSYKRKTFAGLAASLGTVSETVDIQDALGEQGQEVHKFECYIYTPIYEKYKYRVFFVKYGISNYPVNIILQESIAESIAITSNNYVYTCNSKKELEVLIYNIFTSKKLISVMQEIIRINQAKKLEINVNDTTNKGDDDNV